MWRGVLSVDPGSKNFAYCYAEYNLVKGRIKDIKVYGSGMFPFTVTSLIKENIEIEYPKFLYGINKLFDHYKPDHFIAERYQNRGRFRGGLSELVSFMLGAIHFHCIENGVTTEFILSSSWKNWFKRAGLDLEEAYKKYKPELGKDSPHKIDSGLIGLYSVDRSQMIEWAPILIKKLSQL